jgi:hydroxypyruvate isomerase
MNQKIKIVPTSEPPTHPPEMKPEEFSRPPLSVPINRREMLIRTAGFVAAGTAAFAHLSPAQTETGGKAVTNGRIKQSLVHWCLALSDAKWSLPQTCAAAKRLGVESVELLTADQYPVLREHGLTCAIGQIDMAPDPPFLRGFNNPAFWPELIEVTQNAIDGAAAFGVPSVICFTGFSAINPHDPNSRHLSKEEGAKNCVEGLKRIIGYAEKKKINLCIEHLNTRDDSHPMKGHPGYQGDQVDYCVDIIKQVGSPRMKLLFDVYHAQIMDGDVIRRIHQHKDYIGHVHTAGNPGRHEIDQTQELNYRAIMQALLDIGYTGYVGQEFLPTRDPYQGLHEAIVLCDV